MDGDQVSSFSFHVPGSTARVAGIKIIPVGPYEANCVILNDAAGNAWVVDPGGDADIIVSALNAAKFTLKRILFTHGHIDHISALDELLVAFPGTPVYMHNADSIWCFTEINLLPPFDTLPERPVSLVAYGDGDTLADGDLSAKIIHTPGHSPGSVCIQVAGGPLLTGDTLFARSVGRTDLPGGSGRTLVESLKKLIVLEPTSVIIPGHGATSTIGEEIKWNPFIQRLR